MGRASRATSSAPSISHEKRRNNDFLDELCTISPYILRILNYNRVSSGDVFSRMSEWPEHYGVPGDSAELDVNMRASPFARFMAKVWDGWFRFDKSPEHSISQVGSRIVPDFASAPDAGLSREAVETALKRADPAFMRFCKMNNDYDYDVNVVGAAPNEVGRGYLLRYAAPVLREDHDLLKLAALSWQPAAIDVLRAMLVQVSNLTSGTVPDELVQVADRMGLTIAPEQREKRRQKAEDERARRLTGYVETASNLIALYTTAHSAQAAMNTPVSGPMKAIDATEMIETDVYRLSWVNFMEHEIVALARDVVDLASIPAGPLQLHEQRQLFGPESRKRSLEDGQETEEEDAQERAAGKMRGRPKSARILAAAAARALAALSLRAAAAACCAGMRVVSDAEVRAAVAAAARAARR